MKHTYLVSKILAAVGLLIIAVSPAQAATYAGDAGDSGSVSATVTVVVSSPYGH
jgi:hypothetical protein